MFPPSFFLDCSIPLVYRFLVGSPTYTILHSPWHAPHSLSHRSHCSFCSYPQTHPLQYSYPRFPNTFRFNCKQYVQCLIMFRPLMKCIDAGAYWKVLRMGGWGLTLPPQVDLLPSIYGIVYGVFGIGTIFGIIFLLSIFRVTYFYPRRGCPMVLKLCMGS